jgi:hypothetical protein
VRLRGVDEVDTEIEGIDQLDRGHIAVPLAVAPVA